METGRQALAPFTAICFLIGVVVAIQLWLLAAALEAALSGEGGLAAPASGASLGLFLVNAGLLWYVLDYDRRLRRTARDG